MMYLLRSPRLVALVVLSTLAPGAYALTVTTLADENNSCVTGTGCSLREALAETAAGGTVDFSVTGTVVLSVGGLVLDKNISIDGPGSDQITVSGNNGLRVFSVVSGVTVSMSDLTVADGMTTGSGDRNGGCIKNEGHLSLSGIVVEDCRTYDAQQTTPVSGGYGAGIYNAAGGSLNLDGCLVWNNHTGNGGPDLMGTGQYHGGHGGGVHNAGDLVVVDSTVMSNRTGDGFLSLGDAGDGGGIYSSGTAELSRTTLSGNWTGDGAPNPSFPSFSGEDGRGGGVFNSGVMTLTNSTLSGNQTGNDASNGIASDGGGIYSGGGMLRLRNATLAVNEAGDQGGGLYRGGGNVSVKTSIVATNTSGSSQVDCGGGSDQLVSDGYNLVGVDDGCQTVFVNNDLVGTTGSPLDSVLGILEDNGGSTETHLPGDASPAIEAGDPTGCTTWDSVGGTEVPLTEDQRSELRPQDRDLDGTAICDIGSVERRPLPSADLAVTKDDGLATVISGEDLTYSIAVTNSTGPEDATGATVTDTFPSALTCSWTCVGTGAASCASGPIGGDIDDTVNLPVGTSVTYTAVCQVSPSASGNLSNTASVATPPGLGDPDLSNNDATDETILVPTADLVLTKDDGETTAVPGGSIEYTIQVVHNSGASHILGATVTDTLPGALSCTFSCSPTGGASCTAGPVAGNLSDTVNLPVGSSLAYTATCDIALTATGSLSNTAGVTVPAGAADTNPGNNSATDINTLLVDFGDALDLGYPTLTAEDGARHGIDPAVHLGASIDSEADGQPTTSADGDDNDGNDDEDGVTFTTTLDPGLQAQVQVTASAPGFLSAWIDWNADGDWLDMDEQIFDGEPLTAGVFALAVNVPQAAMIGSTSGRFRFSTSATVGPSGPAADGEVEDYLLTVGVFANGFESGDTDAWSHAIP